MISPTSSFQFEKLNDNILVLSNRFFKSISIILKETDCSITLLVNNKIVDFYYSDWFENNRRLVLNKFKINEIIECDEKPLFIYSININNRNYSMRLFEDANNWFRAPKYILDFDYVHKNAVYKGKL